MRAADCPLRGEPDRRKRYFCRRITSIDTTEVSVLRFTLQDTVKQRASGMRCAQLSIGLDQFVWCRGEEEGQSPSDNMISER